MARVKDKIALVTGGVRSLGLAVGARLCQEGRLFAASACSFEMTFSTFLLLLT
jgi:NAD(P)-dependent dehydrogenase (short-subunit alcohol dehydrogenase family)